MNNAKVKNILGKPWKETLIGLSALFIIIDYLAKWSIANFLFDSFLNIKNNFQLFINIFFFIWLLILTALFIKYKLDKRIIDAEKQKGDVRQLLKDEISTKEKYFLEELKKLEHRIEIKIEDDVFGIQREVLDLKINIPFKKVDMGNLIEILEIDIKKNWEWRIDDTLEKIRKHIEEKGMSNHHITSLNKALNSLPEAYKIQKEVISKLMSEKKLLIS